MICKKNKAKGLLKMLFLHGNHVTIKTIILYQGTKSLSACSYKNSQLSSVCYTPMKMAPHSVIKEAQLDPQV